MSIEPVKIILCAHTGKGKTGAQASLAAMGLRLRYIDLDNGSEILRNFLNDPASPYVQANPKVGEMLESVVKLSETRGAQAGKLTIAKAEVWTKVSALIERWVDPVTAKDYGSIASWGPDVVLSVGSFTRLAESAMRFVQGLNGRLNKPPHQSDYHDAQNFLRAFLEIITSPEVNCNVVLECHIEATEQTDGTFQDFPRAVGKAIGPVIGSYFNTLLEIRTTGQGGTRKHLIRTIPTGTLGVKNTAPFKVANEYPIETGLADYFKAVRGG